ncbi:porin [Solimicrobium silvestre]|uniref:Gram-negative porin n=1 Tax=Solimicrobium silvestre TaxID=2099400 RepID=A0A2S9H195_9BURK|nr:porin [Solimicrobium silvestre]PRC93720.1 Gram-negative porin [Solimicrobium silvestre]
MNSFTKNIFAIAVIGPVFFITTLHAQEVPIKFYGVLDAYVGSHKINGANTSAATALNSGGMTTSFWGLSGFEKINATLKVNFALEGFLLLDSGQGGRYTGDGMFSRSAYIGLSDQWGEVSVGRLTNPMYIMAAKSNPFGGSTRLSPLVNQNWIGAYGRNVVGDTAWSNSISYSSPSFNGVKLASQYGRSETGQQNMFAGLSYEQSPVSVQVGLQSVEYGPGVKAEGKKQSSYFIGAASQISTIKIFATYLHASTPDTVKSNNLQLGLAVPVAKGTVMLSSARTALNHHKTTNTHRLSSALGYRHPLSKRTDVYAIYLHDKLSIADAGHNIALGLRHAF